MGSKTQKKTAQEWFVDISKGLKIYADSHKTATGVIEEDGKEIIGKIVPANSRSFVGELVALHDKAEEGIADDEIKDFMETYAILYNSINDGSHHGYKEGIPIPRFKESGFANLDELVNPADWYE